MVVAVKALTGLAAFSEFGFKIINEKFVNPVYEVIINSSDASFPLLIKFTRTKLGFVNLT